MLSGVRYFFSDLFHWLGDHKGRVFVVLGGVALLAGAGFGVYTVLSDDSDDAEPSAPAPRVIVQRAPDPEPEETEDLGFPAFATKNTTRIAGADAVANAAAVALAYRPSTGGVPGPAAVSLVDAADWAGAITAASLVAAPVGAPILVTEGGDVPELTANAIDALGPSGSAETDDRQAFLLGAAGEPDGLETLRVSGDNAAQLAAEVDRLRAKLTGDEPQHLLLASSDEPAFAMPAAAWAARSGDPVLFVQRNSIPGPTRAALERHKGVPAYVLGPESAISGRTFDQLTKLAPGLKRVSDTEPLTNSIAFARYADGSFGWNINDPGHGLVIANTSQPLDAAAAAPLSAAGTWGPLLVTDDGSVVPAAMRGFLLDLKPGYEDDPTRALYNHVWLIGDTEALSVGFQAQLDELVELAPIRSGTGSAQLGPAPGTPESQPGSGGQQGNR